MKYTVHRDSDTQITFQFEGAMDIVSTAKIRQEVQEMIDGKFSQVVFDLENVSYMDSSGIGWLLFLKKKLEEKDGGITLKNIPPRVLKVLEIGKLTSLFSII